MTHEQLTLIEIPSSTPSNPWMMEDGDSCEHLWTKSHDELGMFSYRCYKCKEKRSPDLFLDRGVMLAYAEKVKGEFLGFLLKIHPSMSKADQDRYRRAAHARYWVAKLSFLKVGVTDWGVDENVEKRFPIPPELVELRDSLTPDNKSDNVQNPPLAEAVQSAETFTRGFDTDPQGTLTNLTPSTKTRRNKGEGSGVLFKTTLKRGNKTYNQWWFQYEEKLEGTTKKRSLYISGKKLEQVRNLNDQKRPVSEILQTIRGKQ
jgi:hypothetical protein